MKALGLALILQVLLSGCAEMTAYELVQHRQAVARGEAPPDAIGRACAQAGTVRKPDGNWGWDQGLTQACYREHGWEQTGSTWNGAPTWKRIAD